MGHEIFQRSRREFEWQKGVVVEVMGVKWIGSGGGGKTSPAEHSAVNCFGGEGPPGEAPGRDRNDACWRD